MKIDFGEFRSRHARRDLEGVTGVHGVPNEVVLSYLKELPASALANMARWRSDVLFEPEQTKIGHLEVCGIRWPLPVGLRNEWLWGLAWSVLDVWERWTRRWLPDDVSCLGEALEELAPTREFSPFASIDVDRLEEVVDCIRDVDFVDAPESLKLRALAAAETTLHLRLVLDPNVRAHEERGLTSPVASLLSSAALARVGRMASRQEQQKKRNLSIWTQFAIEKSR